MICLMVFTLSAELLFISECSHVSYIIHEVKMMHFQINNWLLSFVGKWILMDIKVATVNNDSYVQLKNDNKIKYTYSPTITTREVYKLQTHGLIYCMQNN